MRVLVVVVLVVLVSCVTPLPLDERNDFSTEQELWKKLEEIVDLAGVTPNPIPDVAANMLKKRCLFLSVLLPMILPVVIPMLVRLAKAIASSLASGAFQTAVSVFRALIGY